jgi:hypothetical protein
MQTNELAAKWMQLFRGIQMRAQSTQTAGRSTNWCWLGHETECQHLLICLHSERA